MNIDTLRRYAPKDATHYSPFRNEYYDINQFGHKVWDKFNKEWVEYTREPNISKWISLMPEEFNDGHWTEALDRTHTIMVMVDELLGSQAKGYHPAIEYSGLQSDVDKLQKYVMDLYQKIGSKAD